MKKLLKSILISIAAVGMISGSVTAVVSCGNKTTTNDTPNDDKPQVINPTAQDYKDAYNSIKKYFETNSIFSATQLEITAASNLNTVALKTITNRIQQSIFDYINHAPGEGFLTDIQKKSFKNNLTVSDCDVRIPIEAPKLAITSETGHTDSIFLAIESSSPDIQSESVILTGAQYTVTMPASNQDAYLSQVQNVLVNVGTPVSLLTFDINDGDPEVKTKLMNALNAYINDNSSTLVPLLAPLADTTGIKLDTSIITTGVVIEKTHTFKFTIPKSASAPADVNAVEQTHDFSYTVVEKIPGQDAYDNAINDIASRFLNLDYTFITTWNFGQAHTEHPGNLSAKKYSKADLTAELNTNSSFMNYIKSTDAGGDASGLVQQQLLIEEINSAKSQNLITDYYYVNIIDPTPDEVDFGNASENSTIYLEIVFAPKAENVIEKPIPIEITYFVF